MLRTFCVFSVDEWCSQATRRSDSALDHALGDPSANDNPQGIRKGRMRFSAEQVQSLERRFQEQHYLLPAERKLLAARLGMSERQVKTWFQNKRCKRSKSFLRSGLFPVVHFAPAILLQGCPNWLVVLSLHYLHGYRSFATLTGQQRDLHATANR